MRVLVYALNAFVVLLVTHAVVSSHGQTEPGSPSTLKLPISYLERDEFLRELPTDPFEALNHLAARINEFEENNAPFRSIRIQVASVDQLPQGELSSVDPIFDPSGKLIIKLSLLKGHTGPVAILEALTQIQAFSSNEPLKLQTTWLEQKQEMMLVYQRDSTGRILLDSNNEPVLDQEKTRPWNRQVRRVNSGIEALGVSRAEVNNAKHPMAWAELKINVAGGSRLAARELAEIHLQNAIAARDSFETFELFKRLPNSEILKSEILSAAQARGLWLDQRKSAADLWSDYCNARIEKLQVDLAQKTQAAKAELESQRLWLQDAEKRALRTKLEALPEKLDALVAANDREGVARLLEAYLPLAIMEPVEKRLWTEWIDAIRHPDYSKSPLLYRGIQDYNEFAPATRDAAGFYQPKGFLSDILMRPLREASPADAGRHNPADRPQNLTRALRALTPMRLRFGTPSLTATSPLASTPKISEMMIRHSLDRAHGSPFLSFTNSLSLAFNFAKDAVIIARIDPRRLMPNVVSRKAPQEEEILLPLILFPDEVVFYDRVSEGGKKMGYNDFLNRVTQRTGLPAAHFRNFKVAENRQAFALIYKQFAVAQFGVPLEAADRQALSPSEPVRSAHAGNRIVGTCKEMFL
jgi:hypothetical protein